MIPKPIQEKLDSLFKDYNLIPENFDPKFIRLLIVYDGSYVFLTTEDQDNNL